MPEVSASLLKQAYDTVSDALKDKRLSKTSRAILETQRLIIVFLGPGMEDHEKVKEMWSSFQLQKKLQIAIIIALLTELLVRLIG